MLPPTTLYRAAFHILKPKRQPGFEVSGAKWPLSHGTFGLWRNWRWGRKAVVQVGGLEWHKLRNDLMLSKRRAHMALPAMETRLIIR